MDSSKLPYSYQHKYSHVEHDGLQVANNSGPEVVGGEQPGLQAIDLQAIESPNFSGKEHYVVADKPASRDLPVDIKPRRRRRRRWIIGGTISAILIIIAVILGVVLGTRKRPDTQSASGPTADTDSGGTAAGRIRSTEGVWNGTAMATCYAHWPGFWAFLFYQDYTGQVQAAQHTRPADLNIGIRATYPVNIEAANGTALAAGRYNLSGSDHVHLVYVNKQNILSDAWLDEQVAMDNQGNFVTKDPWVAGNLSDLNFKVPTDNRVGIHMNINQAWFGQQYNNWGAKLVVGGADGALHQLSFDWPSSSWSPNIYKFDDSYAYGGVKTRASAATIPNFNTTVYSSTADGSLQYRVQSSTHPNNDTQWPVGGVWQNPITSSTKVAVNSSLSVSWDNDGIMFPNQNGQLGRMSLNMNVTNGPQFGAYSNQFEDTQIMPGTDMTFDSLDTKQLNFYQPNGTSIAFKAYSGLNLLNSGLVVH